VAVGSTRHAAPWKCSMMMLVIGDGTVLYASTSAWTAASLRSVKNAERQ
jgi:hypothetical protein